MAEPTSPKKCAHQGCECNARPGSKYCGEYCEKAGTMTELHCNCGHPGCR